MPIFSKTLLCLFFLAGFLGARTVDELKVAYEVKMLAIEKEHRKALEKLAQGYTRALDQVQKKFQQAGRLEDVLKVVAEKKDLKAEKWPLSRLEASAPSDLIRVRKIYETSRIKAERENAEGMIETSEKMEVLLEQQMRSLTRAGQIAEAKKAKDLLEKMGEDQSITAARELVKRVRLNESAPVAYRLRRSGDDLEVLVRFDKSGQVSMDSPVENVIEITGGKKEKGETKAKVLGEFVGAPGYEVDAYVAFQSDMEKITPPTRGVSLELEAGFEYENRKVLRILMPVKAPNPRVEWPGVLSSIANKSRVKIDFQYFIPSRNEKLKGFSFHWGLAAPIEDTVMDTTGRWTAESLEADSLNEKETLRFFVDRLSGSNKTFNGGNESIYLDDLKVTFLSFAAHVVARYEDNKISGDVATDSSAQKVIVHSGRFL